jgi:hypothetical protein
VGNRPETHSNLDQGNSSIVMSQEASVSAAVDLKANESAEISLSCSV